MSGELLVVVNGYVFPARSLKEPPSGPQRQGASGVRGDAIETSRRNPRPSSYPCHACGVWRTRREHHECQEREPDDFDPPRDDFEDRLSYGLAVMSRDDT